MSSLEEEVIGIERELAPIFSLAEKYALKSGIVRANLSIDSGGRGEALLKFPFKRKERVKIIFPYIGVRVRGSASGILEVIDETLARPATIFKADFYAEGDLVAAIRSFSSLQVFDQSGYGEVINEQKYRIKFTPGQSGSTLRVELKRFYEGSGEVFDIYGVVF